VRRKVEAKTRRERNVFFLRKKKKKDRNRLINGKKPKGVPPGPEETWCLDPH